MSSNSSGKRLEGFFTGKGFYIVLFLCAAVIGVSAWMMAAGNETMEDLNKTNDISLENKRVETIIVPPQTSKEPEASDTAGTETQPQQDTSALPQQQEENAADTMTEDLTQVWSGDIAAAVGLKNTTTGDTLCDEKNQIILESMEFPDPVIRVAIEPKTKAGQEKMAIALGKLAEEDPTFKTYTDEETGQTIIAGMGELHLEIIVDRLLREFRVEANVGRPQVSYKETITKAATVDTRYARQTGGKGQFAHVKLMVEPNEPGKGYEFINQITGGAIPKEFIPCVDQGIQGAMQSGVLAGYEVVDVKVTLLDGSYHEVDSSEMAFKICGSMAFKEACQKAGPTLLEPIMKVVVTAPESYMGDVMGDINARRGQIAGTDIRNGAAIVTASVPLASMFGYATDLRSKTQGRATYSMEPSHFVELPKSLQEKIIHGSN